MRQNDLKKVSIALSSGNGSAVAGVGATLSQSGARRGSEHDQERSSPRQRVCARCVARLPAALATETRAAEELPKLGADLAATSVSGLSSGAYMAGQIQVAHAKDIVGAGIVAGGPYACAESPASRIFPFWPTAVAQNGTQALYQCMKTSLGEPDPVRSAERAKELAEDGAIDPIAGLAADNVYLFSGKEDDTVKLAVVQAAKRFYKEVGRCRCQYHAGRGRWRPRSDHGARRRRGVRRLRHALCIELRLCPGQGDPLLDLWAARPRRRPRLRASSSCSTKAPSPSRETGLPTRAWSMSRKAVRSSPAAGCISRCMAASSRERRWATPSSRIAALPRSPIPTGSWSCSRK